MISSHKLETIFLRTVSNSISNGISEYNSLRELGRDVFTIGALIKNLLRCSKICSFNLFKSKPNTSERLAHDIQKHKDINIVSTSRKTVPYLS